MQTVLIVETDTETIDTLSDLFSGSGNQVDAVDDIEAARHKVAASTPDLIVIGPQIGKSSGFLACSLIKKIPQAKRVPVVLLYTEREEGQVERHRTLSGRAEVYLRKPFDPEDFRTAVSPYLSIDVPTADAVLPMPGEEADIVVEEDLSAAPLTESHVPVVPIEDIVEEVSEIPAPPSGLEEEVDRLRGEVDRLQGEIEKAERQAREAGDSAAKGKGETRQVLELKQALNKRESELLKQQQASLQKDKEILDLKDKANDFERKQLDLGDTVADRDREIANQKGQIDAAVADKDVAAKRADDLARRLKSTQDEFKKAKDDAEAARASHERDSRAKEEAHAATLERLRAELVAEKDSERDRALDTLRGESAADKEAALTEQKASFDGDLQAQQQRHDNEVYEMQERFRRSMNQQEEKLLAERVAALKDAQEHHDADVANLVASHDAETRRLHEQMTELEKTVDDANRAIERHVGEIARLTEERDELRTKRDILDAELKASQVSSEQLRIDVETAQDRLARLEAGLKDASAARDALRARIGEDLVRIDKAKQALAIASDLLNDVEPL